VTLLAAGCGGGGGGSSSTTTTVASSPSSTSTSTSEPTSGSTTVTTVPQRTITTSPEQQSGDETPISTQALFTGRGGVITPQTVRVPPFIAVSVVLESADGQQYSIEVHGRGMSVGGNGGRGRVKLPGLRAGARYVVTNLKGTPKRLTIVANAEPGP
jgi:hypothetical protein